MWQHYFGISQFNEFAYGWNQSYFESPQNYIYELKLKKYITLDCKIDQLSETVKCNQANI